MLREDPICCAWQVHNMFYLRLDANGAHFRVTRPMPMGWHSNAGSADYDAIAYGTPHLAKINDQEIIARFCGVRNR